MCGLHIWLASNASGVEEEEAELGDLRRNGRQEGPGSIANEDRIEPGYWCVWRFVSEASLLLVEPGVLLFRGRAELAGWATNSGETRIGVALLFPVKQWRIQIRGVLPMIERGKENGDRRAQRWM